MSRFEKLSESQKYSLLVKKRESVFAVLTAIRNKSKLLDQKTINQFRSQFERLTKLEEEFKELQEEIDLFNATLQEDKFVIETSKTYTSFLELIDTSRNNYLALAKSMQVLEHTSTLSQNMSRNLPRISLPVFAGEVGEWPEFYALFSSLVDGDDTLSTVNKFQYLRTSLRGDALAVISGLALVPENYPLAIEALKSRYQNKRRLANIYLGNITSFSPLLNGSHKELQRFLNTHENNLNALETVGIPDLWDYAKLHLSLQNLDPSTRRAFEDKVSTQNIPSYADLIKFATERSRVAELMGTTSKTGQVKRRPGESIHGPATSRDLDKFSRIDAITTFDSSKKERPRKEISRIVVSSKPQGGTASSSKSGSPLKCWNCGGSHLYSRCQEPRTTFCYRCGLEGELTTTCPNCNKGNASGRQRRGSL